MTDTRPAPGARIWLEAARPRTLPAAVAPVLVGTAAAARPLGELAWDRFALAMLVALALQVAVNYANDWFDGVKGVDRPDRQGPRRAVASGLVTPAAMRAATFAALAVAGLAGLVLSWLVGWELLLVGLLAVLATLGYSGGARPYASLGLGEVMVFVFFGVVATVGSQYVQDERIGGLAVLASVPVGLIAVALLVVNNLRDIPTDEVAGKRTLAVRLGDRRTRRLFVGLLMVSLGWLAPLAAVAGSPWPLAAAAAAPLGYRAVATVRGGATGPHLVAALERTGQLHLAGGVLLAAGLLLGGR